MYYSFVKSSKWLFFVGCFWGSVRLVCVELVENPVDFASYLVTEGPAVSDLITCTAGIIERCEELSVASYDAQAQRACDLRMAGDSNEQECKRAEIARLFDRYIQALGQQGIVVPLQPVKDVDHVFVFSFSPRGFSPKDRVVLKITNPFFRSSCEMEYRERGMEGENASTVRNLQRACLALRAQQYVGRVRAPRKWLAYRNGGRGRPLTDATVVVLAEFIDFPCGADKVISEYADIESTASFSLDCFDFSSRDVRDMRDLVIASGGADFHGNNLLISADRDLFFVDLERRNQRVIEEDFPYQLYRLRSGSYKKERPFLRIMGHCFSFDDVSDKERLLFCARALFPSLGYPYIFLSPSRVLCNAYHKEVLPAEGQDLVVTVGKVLEHFAFSPLSREELIKDKDLVFRAECLRLYAAFLSRKEIAAADTKSAFTVFNSAVSARIAFVFVRFLDVLLTSASDDDFPVLNAVFSLPHWQDLFGKGLGGVNLVAAFIEHKKVETVRRVAPRLPDLLKDQKHAPWESFFRFYNMAEQSVEDVDSVSGDIDRFLTWYSALDDPLCDRSKTVFVDYMTAFCKKSEFLTSLAGPQILCLVIGKFMGYQKGDKEGVMDYSATLARSVLSSEAAWAFWRRKPWLLSHDGQGLSSDELALAREFFGPEVAPSAAAAVPLTRHSCCSIL